MKTVDRRYIAHFDWISFFLMLALASIGLLFVFSATYHPEQPYSLFFKKQFVGLLMGFAIYAAFCMIDYRIVQRWAYVLYVVLLCALCFTLIKGTVGMGAQRWISLGFIKFQPSELAKLLFPAFATYYLHLRPATRPGLHPFLPLLIILALSSFLIFKQPDLGTAVLVSVAGLTLLWLAGLPKKFFLLLGLALLIGAPIGWKLLRPYQKQRILVLLGEGDKKKERYQIEQSIIAIGSGSIKGKGFLNGTQNKFQFLPESRTDFIFSVLCEEWGFLGAFFIILLYALLFIRMFLVITTIKNCYTQLLGIGLIIPVALSTIVNIGMVLGLLPIVGIPLPFMSYGITHLWITLAALGWYNSIAMRRFFLSSSTI